METSKLMTLPNIENESEDDERIRSRELLDTDTQDDGLTLTRKWLVRHGHSQEEIADSMMLMNGPGLDLDLSLTTRTLTEGDVKILKWDREYAAPDKEIYISYTDNPMVEVEARDLHRI